MTVCEEAIIVKQAASLSHVKYCGVNRAMPLIRRSHMSARTACPFQNTQGAGHRLLCKWLATGNDRIRIDWRSIRQQLARDVDQAARIQTLSCER